MTNATVSLGKVADNIFRDLILFNSNGEKLTKIFMNHWTIVGDDIDYFGLRYGMLSYFYFNVRVFTNNTFTETYVSIANL